MMEINYNSYATVQETWDKYKGDAFRYFNAGYRSFRAIRHRLPEIPLDLATDGGLPCVEVTVECTFALFVDYQEKTYKVKCGTETVEEGTIP